MEESTALMTRQEETAIDIYDEGKFEFMMRLADTLAQSQIIPDHYRNKPSDCFIALYRAKRLNMDPFGYMENSYVVHGRLGHQGKIVLALLNQSGRFQHEVRFSYSGAPASMERKCRAWTKFKGSDDEIGIEMSLQDARNAGWYDKNDSLWKKIPDRMLMWRTAKWLGDQYAPDLLLGIKTTDELQDSEDIPGGNSKPLFERPKPIETHAEVIEPVPAASEEAPSASPSIDPTKTEIPIIQPALNLTNEPQTAPERRKYFEKQFGGEGTTFDSFFVAKKWIQAGQTFLDLTDDQIDRLWINRDTTVRLYESWKKNKANGGSK